ncbi:MAG: pyruvate kinase, partial [Pirellula sp.]
MTRNSLNEARTKIVATVGPACEDEATLAEMIEHGVDIFRINAAHGTQADYERMRSKIVRAGEMTGFHVGILLDLAGPKIRLGKLFNEQPLDVDIGDHITFVRGDTPGNEREVTSNYTRLIDELSLGDRVMLADGMISMHVVEKLKDSVRCEIVVKGTIRSKQGINLPGTSLSVSSMRPEDVDNALWAA